MTELERVESLHQLLEETEREWTLDEDPSRWEPNPFHEADAAVTNGAGQADDSGLPDGHLPPSNGGDPLQFQTLHELCAEVDAAGPRRWLVRGIWPAGSYGVLAAEMKAGKTWNIDDLAVSVASHTHWFGSFPVDDPGPVVIFAGEGGKAAIVRRLRAICTARGLDAEALPIVVCARAPHLSNAAHLALVAAELEQVKPKLVIIDPLYLAARGAKGADLYAMGELLEVVQHLCDDAGAALVAVTHYNRKEGSGPLRITGAGPAEWGRVLIGVHVVSRHTDPATLETTVVTELDLIGGEIPDQTLRLKRIIRAEDPDDLDSPLHYSVELAPLGVDDGASDLPPAARKLLEALAAQDEPVTGAELVDWIAAKYGHGLRRETVSKHLNALARDGAVTNTNPDAGVTEPKLWQRKPDEAPL